MESKERKLWSREDEDYLEEAWGVIPIKKIAERLKRSEDGVTTRAKRIGLGRYYSEHLSFNQISNIMGVHSHQVSDTWKNKGLKYQKEGGEKMGAYYVTMKDLIRFLKKHQDMWDSRRVEKLSFGEEFKWLIEKRKRDLGLPKNRQKKWTKEEDRKLIAYSGKYTQREIGKMLGRTTHAVNVRANRVNGVTKRVVLPWTEIEDEMLVEMLKKGVKIKDMAIEIGRSDSSVYKRIETKRKKGEKIDGNTLVSSMWSKGNRVTSQNV